MKPLWKVTNIYMCAFTYIFTHLHLHIHIHLHLHTIHIYIYIYKHIYICIYTHIQIHVHVHVGVRVRVGGRGERRGEWWSVGRWVGGLVRMCVLCVLIPSAVSLRSKNGAQQFHQVKRMIGGLGNVLFSIYSQTLNG